MAVDLKKTGQCRFRMADEKVFNKYDQMAYPKNWRFTKAFDKK